MICCARPARRLIFTLVDCLNDDDDAPINPFFRGFFAVTLHKILALVIFVEASSIKNVGLISAVILSHLGAL